MPPCVSGRLLGSELELDATASDWIPTEAREVPTCGVALQAAKASATGRIKIIERQFDAVDAIREQVCIMAEPRKKSWHRVPLIPRFVGPQPMLHPHAIVIPQDCACTGAADWREDPLVCRRRHGVIDQPTGLCVFCRFAVEHGRERLRCTSSARSSMIACGVSLPEYPAPGQA